MNDLFKYDYCMCGNPGSCPHKDECLRNIELPPGVYSYALFYKENEECEYFMKNEKEN